MAFEDYEPEEEEEEEEWTDDHLKLLYMISLYAKCAITPTDDEGWIRKNSLLVLIYEGIVAGVYDYDYAPQSQLVGKKRVWMNISQEGKDDIDDLREGFLLNGLKQQSAELQPVTAYQVSPKGIELLSLVPNELRDVVDKFVHGPEGYEDELIGVDWYCKADDSESDEEGLHDDELTERDEKRAKEAEEEDDAYFKLYTEGGYECKSEVTQTEDVSYVSSPYLPQCLRNADRGGDKPMTDNAHRAHESAAGESGIKDELSEAITLNGVRALVGEWVPFGSNQIVSLNEKLGSADRCQGGMFTGQVDKDSPTLNTGVGLTSVKILDYDETLFINFEAEINYPEDPGIIQVENFGMHISEEGFLCYAMHIEAIGDRLAHDISLDMLSRLLVDVHLDSSKIAESLLSFYQRGLLEMVFMDDEENREKFNLLICDDICPKLEASRYMDREENENELKQVLGDTDCAYNLSPDDVLIRGKNGLLIAGPNSQEHEVLLVEYLSLLSREMFMRVFFVRVFLLSAELTEIRALLSVHTKDPNITQKIRQKLSVSAKDIIALTEVLGYLEESLKDVENPPRPKDLPGKRLYTILDIDGLKNNLQFRIDDLEKTIAGMNTELGNLSMSTNVITTRQLEEIFRKIETNTKMLVSACAADERAGNSLEVMEVIFSASMAFHIFSRAHALGEGVDTYREAWMIWIVHHVVYIPGAWFCVNMLVCFVMCYMLKKYMAYLGDLSVDFIQVERRFDMKINVPKLHDYIDTKEVEISDGMVESTAPTTKKKSKHAFGVKAVTKKTTWTEDSQELWCNGPPKIQICIDETNSFLLWARFDVDRKLVELPEEFEDEGIEAWVGHVLLAELREHGVVEDLGKKRHGGISF